MCIYMYIVHVYTFTHCLHSVSPCFPFCKISFFHVSIPHQFHVSILPYPHSSVPQLSNLCIHCTQYFSKGSAGEQEDRFLSETSEAYAFGSNSSSQLAMGSQEKVLKATHMPHMANSQVVRIPLVITCVHTKLLRVDLFF